MIPRPTERTKGSIVFLIGSNFVYLVYKLLRKFLFLSRLRGLISQSMTFYTKRDLFAIYHAYVICHKTNFALLVFRFGVSNLLNVTGHLPHQIHNRPKTLRKIFGLFKLLLLMRLSLSLDIPSSVPFLPLRPGVIFPGLDLISSYEICNIFG